MNRTEQVTGELKRLVGHGADWKRCATLPVLCDLADAYDLPYRKSGEKVVDYIAASIRRLKGPFIFYGHRLGTHETIWAMRLLMQFEGQGQYAPDRRARAIKILKLRGSHSPEIWRRDPSPERDFLRILASYMTGCQSEEEQLTDGLIRLIEAA